jgi:EAL domain-containing protein (putative c-di-GMP-specific phosphodiesterase class I)
VPLAEETGVIVQLGRWVLIEACRTALQWDGIDVAVNVSPIQFALSDVAADVEAALGQTGLAPHRLTVEITEGVLVGHSARVLAQLERVRALGVSIALDDFGTGYSSLSYLGRLPVDKIKIDQSFVKRLPADREAASVIRAIVDLSKALGKVVIAEGIETADQAWMLQAMGCAVGQG